MVMGATERPIEAPDGVNEVDKRQAVPAALPVVLLGVANSAPVPDQA